MSRNKTAIFFSDPHRFKAVSNFATLKYDIYAAMDNADHVLFGGDNIEAFFPKGMSVKDAILHGVADHVMHVVLRPHTMFHSVPGNHEEVKLLFDALDHLQQNRLRRAGDKVVLGDIDLTPYYSPEHLRTLMQHMEEYKGGNFEWDPVAIRVADSLMVHGHFFTTSHLRRPEDQKINSVTEAERWRTLTPLVNVLETVGQVVLPHRRQSPQRTAENVRKNLQEWVESGTALHTHEGRRAALTSLDGITHVFHGHSHKEMMGFEVGGITMHNMGSLTYIPKEGFAGFKAVIDDETGLITAVDPLIDKQRGLIERVAPKKRTNHPSFDGEKRLVVGSDLHLFAPTSTYPHYEPEIMKAFSQADVVLLNGDIFELFHLLGIEQRAESRTMHGVVIEAGYHVMREVLRVSPRNKKGEELVINAIENAIDWLEKILAENPDRQIYFVLGNHENIRGSGFDYTLAQIMREEDKLGFRERLDRLQQKYPNFQWDPEMIILGKGDVIAVHGDLQMDNTKTDAKRKVHTIEMAGRENRQTKAYELAEKPGFSVVKRWATPHAASGTVYDHLQKRAKFGSEYVKLKERYDDGESLSDIEYNRMNALKSKILRYNGGEIFTGNEWEKARHIFFGHTHVRFENVQVNGKHIHNTGGTTTGPEHLKEGLGIITAQMVDGVIVDESLVSYATYQKLAASRSNSGRASKFFGGFER